MTSVSVGSKFCYFSRKNEHPHPFFTYYTSVVSAHELLTAKLYAISHSSVTKGQHSGTSGSIILNY